MNAAQKWRQDKAGSSKSGKISRGFENLVRALVSGAGRANRPDYDYDFVIVGSGYGGSIAAARLSEYERKGRREPKNKPLKICLLERGSEYLPGSFPSGFSEAAGYVRFSLSGNDEVKGVADGLFDIRVNTDMSAIIASGLGGGSLINAGVMEVPDSGVFDTRWPKELQDLEDQKNSQGVKYFDAARHCLGAEDATDILKPTPKKYSALENLAKELKLDFRPAQVSVALKKRTTVSNVQLEKCIQCGDCVTGCNFGAKESLDTNLLVLAAHRGAELYYGATVERIEPIDAMDDTGETWWKVIVNYTDKQLQRRQGKPVEIVARRVILAAGTFGSTEILKRSESDTLKFSPMLGRKFSGNGDMIASIYAHKEKVNAVARYEEAPDKRGVGPTITGVMEVARREKKRHFIVEELAIPNTLHRFFEELVTTAQALRTLSRSDTSRHRCGPVKNDPFAVDDDAIDHTAVLAVLGDDGAGGKLDFGGASHCNCEVGSLNVSWPGAKDAPVFVEQVEMLQGLCREQGPECSVIPNPFWQFLPDNMDYLAESGLRGPLLTVHPLGGCPIGADAVTGVVDHCGRVFDDRRPMGGTYDGLVVLDGSIVPTSLETNPALTIATLSLRAMDCLIRQWNLTLAKGNGKPPKKSRAKYREIPIENNPEANPQAQPTEVQLLERIGGEVSFPKNDREKKFYLEITIRSEPTELRRLAGSGCKKLVVDTDKTDQDTDSRIRIYELETWQKINDRFLGKNGNPGNVDPTSAKRDFDKEDTNVETRPMDGDIDEHDFEKQLEKEAVFVAPVTGEIILFNRKPSTACGRRWRAFWAWLSNRGARDIWQALEEDGAKKLEFGKKFQEIKALTSRAGEIRTLEYQLEVGDSEICKPSFDPLTAGMAPREKLHGTKCLTYSRRANPWRQLMELFLEGSPGRKKAWLSIDLKYLARQGVPLFRITRQRDQPTALADFAAMLGYLLRYLLFVHVWSFRQPDDPSNKPPERYPGVLPNLPKPEVHEFSTGDERDGKQVEFRLTRYPKPEGTPIITIHGYSISGSMFTHPRIPKNAATYFHEKGYDVWILDLRTSGASRIALHPWNFEDVAFKDIPLAFRHIATETGKPIDVLAHCMGAAMLSMAILKKPVKGERFYQARTDLPDLINCLVLSQVGPRLFFSPANIFRAYLANYLLPLMPVSAYQFRPDGEPSLLDRLIDRVLSTLPYPEDEFDRENPGILRACKKTPYTRTRHRADFLYGRDFSIKNVNDGLLEQIDDIFGHLNIRTISQTIHFARWKTITTVEGFNDFVSRGTVRDRWRFNTLSVHGFENDLADVATVELNRRLLQDAGVKFEMEIFKDMGHMDCIIGDHAEQVFKRIYQFLSANSKDSSKEQKSTRHNSEFIAHLPTIGPNVGRWDTFPRQGANEILPVSVGSSPGMISAGLIVVVPVKRMDKKFEEVGSGEKRVYFVQKESRDLRKLAFPDWIRRVPGAEGAIVLFLNNDLEDLKDDIFDQQPYSLDGMLFNYKIISHSAVPSIPFKFSGEPQWLPTNLNNLIDTTQSIDQYIARCKSDIDDAIGRELDKSESELEPCLIELGFGPSNASRKSAARSPRLSFALASCQYPAGILDSIPAYESYGRLKQRLGTEEDLSFLMLVGDQIYVDATAGLFDLVRINDKFRRPYQMLYGNRNVRGVMRCLPTFNMLDDHEIDNNWEPIPGDSKNDNLKNIGCDAFLNWQEKYDSLRFPKSPKGCLWYDFEAAGMPFFVLDSRTDRNPRNASNYDTVDIIRSQQFEALEAWLGERLDDQAPKFIISPAIPFPRSRSLSLVRSSPEVLRSDRWDGYPHSHDRLVRYIWDKKIRNVVFLSGDEHVSMVSEIKLSETSNDNNSSDEIRLFSIHSSGLYAPFPFANARIDDFELDEIYKISLGGNKKLAVDVRTSTNGVYPGDGFAILRVIEDKPGWRIEVEFSRADRDPKLFNWKA